MQQCPPNPEPRFCQQTSTPTPTTPKIHPVTTIFAPNQFPRKRHRTPGFFGAAEWGGKYELEENLFHLC